jgi:hypothetical protein
VKTIAIVSAITILSLARPVAAVDFLGIELCRGSIDTRVELPEGSSLVLESVEIGDHGGLVMLLSASKGKVMENVDDLMTGLTGVRGAGDDDTLEWSDARLTAVAQRVAKKYAALAVTSTDECRSGAAEPVVAGAAPVEPVPAGEPTEMSPTTESAAAAAAVVAGIQPAPAAEPAPTATTATDFEVIGAIAHEAADRTWVDVMGVVANHTTEGYRLATFDLSLFDSEGALICVDTISVSVLKTGQERAFRDAIRCPGYDAAKVARLELQFAGGF